MNDWHTSLHYSLSFLVHMYGGSVVHNTTKFKKYSDVVGIIHKVDNNYILPIYHPSPISPMSYKGNLPVFEYLKEWLGDK